MAVSKPNALNISSLRGGMNDDDPPHALPDDQCVNARNVQWIRSTVGERRQGTTPITLSASVAAEEEVTWLARHLPTNDETQSELWALGVTGTSSASMSRKTTTWSDVTLSDAMDLSTGTQFHITSRSLHGKHFIAYNSTVDLLHVWDGASLRRCGLPQPSAAPTAANTAVAGSFTGVRYYRVRWATVSGSTVLRRSEPSDTLTFTPSGSFNGAVVTRPTTTGAESPTHWEMEASTDAANFYMVERIAIATTTFTDTNVYTVGYTFGTLSEDIGDYTRPGSCRFLSVDEDRLLMAGSWEDSALASRVSWTPVYNDPGVGNDERIPIATDNFLDLDGFEGGRLTGLSSVINGYLYGFKYSHIYRLVRTGNNAQAYDAICLTKQRGAIDGSVVDGIDQSGRPCVYFIDPSIGPCRIGFNGLQQCGQDINQTWLTANVNADSIVSKAVYYPKARQIQWWIATNGANTPNLTLVLQTSEMQDTQGGTRRGWSIWDGTYSLAHAVCLYAENVEDNTARSLVLRPLIAVPVEGQGLVHLTDTGNNDSGIGYTASITTKPYSPAGILNQFGVMAGALFAKAAAGVSVLIRVVRDFGIETKTIEPVSLTPSAASETHVIKNLDDLSLAEMNALQVTFTDASTDDPTSARWELNALSMKLTGGQTS